MAQRSELFVLRRAHGIYFNLVSLLRLRSMEALYLAGEVLALNDELPD